MKRHYLVESHLSLQKNMDGNVPRKFIVVDVQVFYGTAACIRSVARVRHAGEDSASAAARRAASSALPSTLLCSLFI